MKPARDLVRLTLHEHGRQRSVSWRDVGRLPWDDYALVCGAGGSTGACFEAGLLLALTLDHGVQLDGATQVIGTSAGSITGSLIALGFEGHELAALVADAHQEIDPIRRALEVRFNADVPPTPGLFSMVDATNPLLWVGVARALVRRDLRVAALRSLKRGSFDLRPYLEFLRGVDWPALAVDLTVCATSNLTAKRVELTAGGPLPLLDAVAASCAVPAVFAPIRTVGDLLVDGGVTSPTNADLVAGTDGPGLVAVLSPMSSPTSGTVSGCITARHARTQLARELRSMGAGQRVLVIEPDGDLGRQIVDDPLQQHGHVDLVRTSFLGASSHRAA